MPNLSNQLSDAKLAYQQWVDLEEVASSLLHSTSASDLDQIYQALEYLGLPELRPLLATRSDIARLVYDQSDSSFDNIIRCSLQHLDRRDFDEETRCAAHYTSFAWSVPTLIDWTRKRFGIAVESWSQWNLRTGRRLTEAGLIRSDKTPPTSGRHPTAAEIVPPEARLMRLPDAINYLATNKNTFRESIRPRLPEIRQGVRQVAYDRQDLDRYIENQKTLNTQQPSAENGPCVPTLRTNRNGPGVRPPASSSVGKSGMSTKSSADAEWQRVRGRAISKRRASSSPT